MHCGLTVGVGWSLTAVVAVSFLLSISAPSTKAFRIYDLLDAVHKREAEEEWSIDPQFEGISEDELEQEPARNKRYTEFQENALSICAGGCMEGLRKTYSECYDMCHWNGRTPDPWVRFEKQQKLAVQAGIGLLGGASSSPVDSSDDNAHRLLKHRFGQRKSSGSSSSSTSQGTSAQASSLPKTTSSGGNQFSKATSTSNGKATTATGQRKGKGKGKAAGGRAGAKGSNAGGARRKTKTKGKQQCI